MSVLRVLAIMYVLYIGWLAYATSLHLIPIEWFCDRVKNRSTKIWKTILT